MDAVDVSMSRKGLYALALANVMAIASAPVTAGAVYASNYQPQDSGIVLGCGDPARFLLVDRDRDSTRLSRISANGTEWSLDLPAMTHAQNDIHYAPDGAAAVVSAGTGPGNAWIVADGHATRIDRGYVGQADFEADRVVIPIHLREGEDAETGVLVGVYDLAAHRWTGRHLVRDPIEVTVDRAFEVRLTRDGRHVYYVLAQQDGLPARVEIRDARTWRLVPQRSSLVGHGDIYDLVMLTASEGFLVSREGLFEIRQGATVRLAVPPVIGRPWRVIDLDVPGYQVVQGDSGWGLRHRPTGRWIETSPDPYAEILPSPDGWLTVTRTVDEDSLRSWVIGSRRAKLAREATGRGLAAAGNRLACLNAYGAMWQDGGRFRWIPTPPVK